MLKHLTNLQVERYHERALAPAELINLDEHLVVCADCRIRLGAASEEEEGKLVALRKDLSVTSTHDHVDDEQLADYADGRLNAVDAEIVSSHLAVCHRCELVASDLVVFKDEIAADLGKEYAPPAQPAMPAQPALPRRFSAFLKSLFTFNSPTLAFGMGTLALVVVAVIAWVIVRQNRTDTSQSPVVQSSPTPAPSVQDGNEANSTPTPEPSQESAPPLLLALNDGPHRIAVDEQGNLTGLDEFPPAYRQMVRTALNTQQPTNVAALSGLGVRQGVLRGAAERGSGFAPLNPVGKVVLTNRPTLSWSKLDGATEYSVAVYDSKFNLVASSPPLTTNSWNVPSALTRGEIYSWQVTAIKDGEEVKSPRPPAPEAKFKPLDQKRADELDRARRAHSSSHLTMGVLYAQAGLLDDAERELNALVRANPTSDVARKLLSNVRAMKKGKR